MAQDVIVSENDCGTGDGIYVEPIVESGEIIEPLRDRIVGRVALEDQHDYEGNVIVGVNQEITEELASAIQAAGIERVKIRSVLTCESRRGVCQLCYGRNLATGRLVERGEAVGVIAAQSIGEPGTQLTMRTFHIGGAATGSASSPRRTPSPTVSRKYIGIKTVRNEKGELIAMNRNGIARGGRREGPREGALPGGLRRQASWSRRRAGQGQPDPARVGSVHLLDPDRDFSGTVHFKDLIEGVTFQEQVDEVTGMSQWVVIDSPDEKRHADGRRPARRRRQARRASATSCRPTPT